MAIQTLTGGELEAGSAFDNSETDQFTILGAGNIVIENGGNLIVHGFNSATFGLDTGTTVMLGAASGVNDLITLNGGGNVLSGGPLTGGSTVSYTVSGAGATGLNSVTLNNSGGTTTINLDGTGNSVTLNGDATNTVSTGGGGAAVAIGSFDDDLFGFTSTVTLSGDGNTVTGGDENFTITGGVNGNTIRLLGDGENTVSVSGVSNTISVWGGDNTINAGGSGAVVTILGVDGQSLAAFADPNGLDGPDNSPVPRPRPTT